jgi:hypothetical protein
MTILHAILSIASGSLVGAAQGRDRRALIH